MIQQRTKNDLNFYAIKATPTTFGLDCDLKNNSIFPSSIRAYDSTPPFLRLVKQEVKIPIIDVKISERNLMNFIIMGFQTIVFILIVISTTFQPICPPAFRL